MNALKAALKFIASIAILSFLIIGSYLIRFFIRNRKKQYIRLCKFKCFIGTVLKRAMQVEFSVDNREVFSKSKKKFLIVSNHQTYIDTFILSTVFPAVFIANAGLKNNFFSYALNYSIGNIFIERKKGTKILKEIEKVTNALREDVNVILFPEGTTSDGETLLSFQASFFKSAFDANVDILPVCIQYIKMNGKKITGEGKRSLIYSGHMNLFVHLFRILENGMIVAKVTLLDSIKTGSSLSRKELAEKAYQVISTEFSKEKE